VFPGAGKNLVKHILVALVLLVISTPMAGCYVPARRPTPDYVSAKSIIFNPEWTGIPPFYVARTDWPSTVVFSNPGEELAYRETIIDRQGQFAGRRDQTYYRRFTSIRTGRGRR